MNKFWSILGIGIILLSACHSGKTLKDDEIDPALRKQLRQYGEQVIDGCAENRPDRYWIYRAMSSGNVSRRA